MHSMQEPTASNSVYADIVTFGAYLNDACQDFNSKYKLVQRFDIPPGKMDIIHCACLATSITQSAKNYSTLYHMCHWFAALFFHTARSLCMGDDSDGCVIEHGPLYADRGKVAFVRLVDDNCVLLPGGAVTLDLILGQLRDGMVKEGIAQELVAAFEATLRSDIEVMDDHPELKKAPVRQMLHISQSVSATVRARMDEPDTIAEWECRLAERERKLKERERRVEELERERKQRLDLATRGQAV